MIKCFPDLGFGLFVCLFCVLCSFAFPRSGGSIFWLVMATSTPDQDDWQCFGGAHQHHIISSLPVVTGGFQTVTLSLVSIVFILDTDEGFRPDRRIFEVKNLNLFSRA